MGGAVTAARSQTPQVSAPQRSVPSPVKEAAGAPSQSRKVFVGGIPQEMTQEDLQNVFNGYWVKKAWLQQCRVGTNGENKSYPPRNHRGFGFVIFYDTNAIDQLLGSADNKFIRLESGKFEGKQLEVKRAVSSNEMKTSGKPADQPSPDLQALGGSGMSLPRAGQPAAASQVPWPTLTPVDQHATSTTWPIQQAQPCMNVPNVMAYQMAGMPCSGVMPQMPQMSQVMQPPFPQVGCGGFPGAAAQGRIRCS
jgi:hypothetical protein